MQWLLYSVVSGRYEAKKWGRLAIIAVITTFISIPAFADQHQKRFVDDTFYVASPARVGNALSYETDTLGLFKDIAEKNINRIDCFLKSQYFADTGRLIMPSRDVIHRGNTVAEQEALTNYVIKNWSAEKIGDYFSLYGGEGSTWANTIKYIEKEGKDVVFRWDKRSDSRKFNPNNARDVVEIWLKRELDKNPEKVKLGLYTISFSRSPTEEKPNPSGHAMNLFFFKKKSSKVGKNDYYYGFVDNQANSGHLAFKQKNISKAIIHAGDVRINEKIIMKNVNNAEVHKFIGLSFKDRTLKLVENLAKREDPDYKISPARDGMLMLNMENYHAFTSKKNETLYHLRPQNHSKMTTYQGYENFEEFLQTLLAQIIVFSRR